MFNTVLSLLTPIMVITFGKELRRLDLSIKLDQVLIITIGMVINERVISDDLCHLTCAQIEVGFFGNIKFK